MRAIFVSILAAGLLAAPAGAMAGIGAEAGELEAARANARAGGPLSERDKELLDRWGCLSGTRSGFCIERERRHSGAYQRSERKSRRHR